MLEVLVASRAPRQAAPGAFVGAALLHATLLTLAIVTTGVTVQAVTRAVADTTLIYLPRLAPVRAQQAPRPGIPGGGGSGSGGPGFVVSVNPPPLGFQVVDVVTEVPTGIPSVDQTGRAFDPRDFTGRGVEGGAGWGVIGGTGAVDQIPPPEGSGEIVYAATVADDRFTPAELLVPPRLVYPPAMEAAGIPGRATLQFIIDTVGLVELPSVQVVSATHEAFATAARESISEIRFAPARFGGHPVRQLSRLPVKFTVHPSPS